MSASSIFHALSLKGRGQPRPFIYPLREWGVCLMMSLAFALALFGYAGIDFKTQLSGADVTPLNQESVPVYRAEEADAVIRYYEGRSRTFNDLRQYRPLYIPAPEPIEGVAPINGEG